MNAAFERDGKHTGVLIRLPQQLRGLPEPHLPGKQAGRSAPRFRELPEHRPHTDIGDPGDLFEVQRLIPMGLDVGFDEIDDGSIASRRCSVKQMAEIVPMSQK
ncbi:hypothetical protein [Bradyrhizobium sp. OK095]|uniref:hypothetical protein n=1 Tax=Bradyrhizobium sp. OK095 TaxID=1882760 RepID=UPI001FCD76D1|nr:hypothetical protein [Bradyrhizobium sp. OK095]